MQKTRKQKIKRRALQLLFAATVIGALGAGFASRLVDNYFQEKGVAGSYLAARQAARDNNVMAAGMLYRAALLARPDDPFLTERAFHETLAAGSIVAARSYTARLIDDNQQHGLARLFDVIEAFPTARAEEIARKIALLPPGPMSKFQRPSMSLWLAYRNYQAAGDDRAALAELRARIAGVQKVTTLRVANAVQLGLVLESLGQPRAAEAAYRKGLKARGAHYLGFALAYGAQLERAGQAKRARAIYDLYVAARGAHPLITAAQARIASRKKPPKIQLTATGGLAYTIFTLADIILLEGGQKPGLIYLNLARYLDPELEFLLLLEADAYTESEHWAIAARKLATIRPTSPLYKSAVLRRADALRQLDEVERAIALIAELLAQQPDDPDLLRGIGELYRSAERFDAAEASYDRAIAALEARYARRRRGVPDAYWHFYFARGIARERNERWSLAEQDLRRARTMSNNEPHVLNYLGYSWVEQGQRLDEGLEIIEMAVKKNPRNGFFVDSLGWAHYQMGRYALAVRYLETASRLEPVDPVITDHLGDALWRTGREIEARYQWRKALGFDPEDDTRAAIQTKLIHGL